MKFKKGDRVRVNPTLFTDLKGKTGIIDTILGDMVARVVLDQGGHFWARQEEMEPETVLKPDNEFMDLWDKAAKGDSDEQN